MDEETDVDIRCALADWTAPIGFDMVNTSVRLSFINAIRYTFPYVSPFFGACKSLFRG